MYIPKMFRMDDMDEVMSVLRAHPFATVISIAGNQPAASHVPLEVEQRNGKLVLTGHLARANPQWKTFQENDNVLVIFQGPHTYVSSSWYEHMNVPTWNYIAVHVSGKVKLLDDERFRETLAGMLDRYETARPNGVTWNRLPSEYVDQQLKAIVGFEIIAETIEGKQKMSQNRSDSDFTSIVQHLDVSEHESDKDVGKVMKRIRPHLFSNEG